MSKKDLEKDLEVAFPADPDRQHSGMSLRDWFAGHAIAGVWATSIDATKATGDTYYSNPENVAVVAYDIADAMLAERDKE